MAARKTSTRKPKPAAKTTAAKRAPAKRAARKPRKAADAPPTMLEALIVWRNWTMLDDFWREILPLPDRTAAVLARLTPAGVTIEELLAASRPDPGRVLAGVERELREIDTRSPELARSGLAASAITLAIELDHPHNSATAKSNCARQLRETLDRLRELAPAAEEDDSIDQLRARHTARTERR